MARTRKLTIEILGEDRSGKAFQGVAKDAKRAGDKVEKAGEDAGKGFADGIKAGSEKVGSTFENAGSTAGDLFSGGFDVGAIADMITGAFGGLSKKLGPVLGGAGLAAGAALAVGVLNGFEVEASTDKLAAQLGGGEWAEGMGDIAGTLYGEAFGESIAETGQAVRQVVQRNLLPEDATDKAIEGLSRQFLTFTDVMEQDMDMATQAVSKMLKTGIADDGTEALDILTRGMQQGADMAGDLLETFQEYSGMFKTVGISAEEATGLMVQGLGAGARDADKVADALKEFGIRAKDGSEASAEGFKAIGLNAKEMTAAVAKGGPDARKALDTVLDGLRNMKDPAERNAAAIALFGTQAEDMGDALFALDLDTAAAGLGNVEGATDKSASAYDNASTKIEEFRRKGLQKLTEFVGNSVLPKLEGLTDWAKENPAAFKVIAGVIGGVLTVAMLAYAASAAVAAVNTLIAMAPFLLIGAVIAGLAALVIIHFDTIKNAIMTAFNWVKDNWPLLLAILTGPIGIAVLLIVSHWDKIKGAALAAFNWVKENWPLILAILTGPIGLAVLAISKNWDKIKDGAKAAKDWIVDRFNGLVSFVTGLPGKIASAASGMFDGIKNAFKSAINGIIRLWNGLSFPSVTVGGGDPLGSFGPSLPEVTIGGWDLPNIPLLAAGGLVKASPGGTLALLGEGRDDEAVIPLRDGMLTGDTFIIDLSGAVILDEIDLERTITQAVNKAQGKGVTLKARRRSR